VTAAKTIRLPMRPSLHPSLARGRRRRSFTSSSVVAAGLALVYRTGSPRG